MKNYLKLLLISISLFIITNESFAQNHFPGDSLYTLGKYHLENEDYIQAAINLTAFKVYYILTRRTLDYGFIRQLDFEIDKCNYKIMELKAIIRRREIDIGIHSGN